eukprot:677509-Karenia_brevis.AAC.1
MWNRALEALQCNEGPWTPAGLRGGGATDFFLRHQDTLALRRRGRWTQLITLDRYLQEGVVLMHANQIPDSVTTLAQLAVVLFQPDPKPAPGHFSREG